MLCGLVAVEKNMWLQIFLWKKKEIKSITFDSNVNYCLKYYIRHLTLAYNTVLLIVNSHQNISTPALIKPQSIHSGVTEKLRLSAYYLIVRTRMAEQWTVRAEESASLYRGLWAWVLLRTLVSYQSTSYQRLGALLGLTGHLQRLGPLLGSESQGAAPAVQAVLV